MYHKEIFDNGIRVVLHPMPHMSSATVGVWVGAGSRYETETNNGISHFLEHLLFKDTAHRTCRELRETIESKGGILNGFTAEEMTCYWAKVTSKNFAEAVDVLHDMISSALLKDEDIEKEKGVVLEEISMYLDLPMHYVNVIFDELLWPDQPLGRLIVGKKDIIKTIDQKILREYMQKFYGARNITVAVAGAIDNDDAIKAVSIFKDIPGKERNIFSGVRIDQKNPRVKIYFKETEQIHLCIGGRGYHRRHPDKYTLLLLETILGGNSTSRLFEEIREQRGLAYRIRSSVQAMADTGSIVVTAGVAIDRLDETIRLIVKEFKKFKNEPVASSELAQAKDYCRGQMQLSLEDTSAYMQWLGENELAKGEVPSPEEVMEKIDNVTAEDIKKVAQEVFVNKNMCLAVIGPVKDAGKLTAEFRVD